MKTTVLVKLQAVKWVAIEVEHEEGKDPTELTAESADKVFEDKAGADWEIVHTELG